MLQTYMNNILFIDTGTDCLTVGVSSFHQRRCECCQEA